jgi:hypothetical protein
VTALLIVYRGRDVVRCCDAKCYDADEEECVCVCGGASHGVGYEQALANAREMAAEWAARARAADSGVDVQLDTAVQHVPLF